ncbi:MAG: LysM peptidoglycan-binding domain-containing protein [Treponema sp.]|nr:LysM peptidoglycan-binding domain-containing protein [Treponema sp.]
MVSNIGIKIANGEFYPIMEENSLTRKRLILTTVHDDQPSVQIDLFRSAVNTMTEAQYIGSLVVENIKAKPRGEPSIEMVMSSNSDGEIIAEAIDLDTSAGGEHYVLTVSLKSLDETSRDMDIPDFELESNEEPPSGLYNAANRIREKQTKRTSVLPFVLIGLLLILGLLAVWLFFLGGMDTVRGIFNKPAAVETVREEPKIEPEPVRQTEPVRQAEPVRQTEPVRQAEPVRQTEPVRQEPVPVIQSAPPTPRTQVTASRRNPPVASYNVPATIPREGVNYRIRWGDTLWDISEAFYRDPWLYPRIARHNNIRNPNLIISGRIIRIPPKN